MAWQCGFERVIHRKNAEAVAVAAADLLSLVSTCREGGEGRVMRGRGEMRRGELN